MPEEEKSKMDSKKYTGLDVDGMPLADQWKLESKLREYKYQVKIKLSNGRIRYVHSNEQKAVEAYAKGINAKIVWIKKL